MSDGYIQVPTDSTGKKVDTSEITVGAQTVERQRIVLADPATAANLVNVSADGGLQVQSRANLTASTPTQATITGTDSTPVASNASRKGLTVRNISTSGQVISLAFGQAAVLNNGVTLNVNDAFTMGAFDFTTAAVHAIASAGSATLAIQEYT